MAARERTAARGRSYRGWFSEVPKALEEAGVCVRSKRPRADAWLAVELTTLCMLVLLVPFLWALPDPGAYPGLFWTAAASAVCLGASCVALARRFRSLPLLFFALCTLALPAGGTALGPQRTVAGATLIPPAAAAVAGAGIIAVFRGLLGGRAGTRPLAEDRRSLLQWSLLALWAVEGGSVVLLGELLGLRPSGELGPVLFLTIPVLSGTGLLCLRRSRHCARGTDAEASWAVRGVRHGVARAVFLVLVSTTFAAASNVADPRSRLERGLVTLAAVAMPPLFVSFYFVALCISLLLIQGWRAQPRHAQPLPDV